MSQYSGRRRKVRPISEISQNDASQDRISNYIEEIKSQQSNSLLPKKLLVPVIEKMINQSKEEKRESLRDVTNTFVASKVD